MNCGVAPLCYLWTLTFSVRALQSNNERDPVVFPVVGVFPVYASPCQPPNETSGIQVQGVEAMFYALDTLWEDFRDKFQVLPKFVDSCGDVGTTLAELIPYVYSSIRPLKYDNITIRAVIGPATDEVAEATAQTLGTLAQTLGPAAEVPPLIISNSSFFNSFL